MEKQPKPQVKVPPPFSDFVTVMKLLQSESPRGQVLLAAALLEELLGRVLLAFFRETKSAQTLVSEGRAALGTLSSRIDSCHALGLTSDDEHHNAHLIRGIRNKFAHKFYTDFQQQSIKDACENFKTDSHAKDIDEPSAHQKFLFAATMLLLHMSHRPIQVIKQRRRDARWDS